MRSRFTSLAVRIVGALGLAFLLGASNGATRAGVKTFGGGCGDPPKIGLTGGDKPATTTEAGGEADFEFTLVSKPTSDVTVHFYSDNEAEGAVVTPELTFTAANWQTPQAFEVRGVADGVADGPKPYHVRYYFETQDLYYSQHGGLLTLTNLDEDSP